MKNKKILARNQKTVLSTIHLSGPWRMKPPHPWIRWSEGESNSGPLWLVAWKAPRTAASCDLEVRDKTNQHYLTCEIIFTLVPTT